MLYRKSAVRMVALLLLSLTLAACSDFEGMAYKTLVTSKAGYEQIQSDLATDKVSGRISQAQWDQFAAFGNKFIVAHNTAVDAAKQYSAVKNTDNQYKVQAALLAVTNLLMDIQTLVNSFKAKPKPAAGVILWRPALVAG